MNYGRGKEFDQEENNVMNKILIHFFVYIFLISPLLFIPAIQGSHQILNGYSFFDVHVWPDSLCQACHFLPRPDAETSRLLNPDPSRLCEACHKGTVTILPSNRLSSDVLKMKNHPIKFSPLDFDPEQINHSVIREGKYFYVSGESGKVPLFGDTKETAIAECGTCHEPHGRLKLHKLQRIDNSKNQLCLTCHINIRT